ncbi:transcriptional repressor LexA [Roseisolibacter sp. H3M3-2]|uniref:transcriptional repressor LexA n=1 Tax=Roseisolibacter sp. H3M3-2 TaxID=3031323 RepID=UPI0023DAC152|nr:transcriptional repressor LexA [Roseisolibacter sp. H3M3-2]MDF1502785.1 transcriptional repressor LexA [Roseisolibacter sp. H3M3-2]
MAEPLTPIERKVYQYLIDFLAENTYQPSIREIGKRFRIKSTKTVSDLLNALTQKGYIERDPSRSRGVRILGYQGTTRIQPVPYYGRIHAGEPALLPEAREGFVTFDRRFVPGEDAFLLRVKGDSMVGRGILDGDFVMVSPSTPPGEGDVIAARLGVEATVKTLTYRDGETVLVPANPAEREIAVRPSDDFAVLGVVCGIFRPFFDRDAFQGAVAE